ncbi:MAG: PAS domain-containing protein [Rhodospirillaceae bacterium]|nr:PAS domain-containing protein [Rhodospirillaceae bacterium]
MRNLTIIERPESVSVRALHSYWASKRGDRRAPGRSDIDPIEIKSHLSTLFMLDVIDEGRDYHYRLIGTDIVEASGRDVTGARFSDLYATQPEALALVLRTFAPVVSEGRPVFAVGRMFWRPDRDFRHFEGGYFPLSTDGTSVDLMLCKMCFLDRRRPDEREATRTGGSP